MSTPRPVVSVVTATRLLPDRLTYLRDLYDSIAASQGVEWEWVLVVDGPTTAEAPINGDDRVRVLRLPRNVGQASALNFGMQAARGDYVITPDDDDTLIDGALRSLLDAVHTHDVSWASGSLVHQRLDADGAWFDDDVWSGATRRGLNRPGDPWHAWMTPDSTLPLCHAAMLVEADLARAVGGLQAIGQGEGLGYVMAVTSVASGWMLDEPVYRYRQHLGQSRQAEGFTDLELLVRQVAWRRGCLLFTHGVAGEFV